MQNQHEEYAGELATITNEYLKNIRRNIGYSIPYIAERMTDNVALKQEIERIKMQNSLFDSVMIVNRDGGVIASKPATVELQEESIKGIISTAKRGPEISNPFQVSGGQQAIFMSHPIYSEENEYIGFIGGTIYLTEHTIFQLILGDHFDEDVSISLVDSDGLVILGQTSHQRMDWKSDNVQVVKRDGKTVLVSRSVVPLTEWALIVQRPLEKELVPKAAVIKGAIVPLLPFLLVVFLIVIWWAVKIAQSIQQLATSIEEGLVEKKVQHLKKVNGWYFETHYLKNALLNNASFIQNRVANLKQQSMIDPLTGITNRRIINEVLNDYVMKEVSHTLIFLDLDYFKSINDTYGHTVGDEVLKSFAKNMQSVVDKNATCGRFGGEEFLILLPNKTIEEALEITEELRVKQASTYNSSIRAVTFSAGIAAFPTMAKTPEQLIGVADEALYKAKQSGRNGVRIAEKHF